MTIVSCQKQRRHIGSWEDARYNLDALGGLGKTFLANLKLSDLKMQHKIAVATAMSGIASIILVLCATFHNKFGVPIPCVKDSCSKIEIKSNEAEIIKMIPFYLLIKYQ